MEDVFFWQHCWWYWLLSRWFGTLQKATVPMMSRVTAAKSCHCKLEKREIIKWFGQFSPHICGLEVNANSGKVPKPNRLFTSSRESRRRLWQRLGTAWTWRWRKLKMIAPWTLRRVLMWSGKYQWLDLCFLSFTWESDLNLTWVLKQASEKPRRNAMNMIRYLKKGVKFKI